MTTPELNPSALSQAVRLLRGAEHVVIFTGAGVSAESGIATFRDEGGVWHQYPPELFANWRGLIRTAFFQPERLAQFVVAVLEPIASAKPNAGHYAIAEIARHVRVTVVTQNNDGLHTEAGSATVHEIHGSFFEIATRRGRFVRRIARSELLAILSDLRWVRSGPLALPRLVKAIRPLIGLGCRGVHRPRVVLFGEGMAQPAWDLAEAAVQQCDLLLSIGTSEAVMPAAALPLAAKRAGATIIRIDPKPGLADIWLAGRSAEVLPLLVKKAFGMSDR